ncbi:hypothetical protein NDU88_006189 [Pleurodeles waltl]|uniref:Uncharacterized protein n=1 Tax=Pleurodeles waltl TaxID=8319 RepID=A0AAV7LZH6_PLEWA|nr:hypothetical protein NDU88_006189 [Pleurodeles waltl]
MPALRQRGPRGEGVPATSAILTSSSCPATTPQTCGPAGRTGGSLGPSGRARVTPHRGRASHLVLPAPFGVPPVPQRQGSEGGARSRPPQGLTLLPRSAAISARPVVSCCGRHLCFLSRSRPDRRTSARCPIPVRSCRSTSLGAPGSQGSPNRRLSAPSDRVN